MNRRQRLITTPHTRARSAQNAKQLRRQQTPSEVVLWARLRDRQFQGRKFRRQYPVGAFIVDFYCAEERLVVEIDGPIHASQRSADAERQRMIESTGLQFVRLTDAVANADINLALQTIASRFNRDNGEGSPL